MYVDGKHDGICVYEFKIRERTSNMAVGIEEGRESVDKQLHAANIPHHLFFYHGSFYETGRKMHLKCFALS